ncbi:orcokinin peptides isoform X2 [Megachile rotundata]|uniref:orcokinin peptides isoform X2 n=1 Tax=Megachile rotundata TaxID=143995 RepID=UPI003FD63EE7
MSSYTSCKVSSIFVLAIAVLWLAIAFTQVEANALQRDLYGPVSGEFLAGYFNDHDAKERDVGRGRDPDSDRASVRRNYIPRMFDPSYGANFLDEANADDAPINSKSFDFLPSDRSLLEPSTKRNIDEIDRTAFDNFFKRNFAKMDRASWNEFVKRLADYLERRTRTRTHYAEMLG